MASQESVLSQGASLPVTQPVSPNQTSTVLQSLVEQFNNTQYIANFRKATTPQQVDLKTQVTGQGYNNDLPSSVDIKIPNNGLTLSLVVKHTTTITVANTNTTAETIDISPWFPYVLYQNNQLSINGPANSPHSVSSLGDLFVAVRNKIASLIKGGRVSPPQAMVNATFGANLTPTASATFSLSGYQSFSVAASSTGTITVTWFEKHKLAASRLNPMGTIPMNNTQLDVQFTKTMGVGFTNQATPSVGLYNVPAGVNITIQDTMEPTYHYWSLPSDPALYSRFVSQIYLVSEQSNIITNATGSQAFVYNLPLSQYIMALHTFWTDGNGNPLSILPNLANANMQLGAGAITPVKFDVARHYFEQALDYGMDFSEIPGYLLWDGNDTAELVAVSDDTGWFNTYNAANPALVIDVVGNPTLPLKTRVVRESLIDGTIQSMYNVG